MTKGPCKWTRLGRGAGGGSSWACHSVDGVENRGQIGIRGFRPVACCGHRRKAVSGTNFCVGYMDDSIRNEGISRIRSKA